MSLEFEYLCRKSRCEMLSGRDDISNDVITLGTCFSLFGYIHAHSCFTLIGGNLTVQSMRSHSWGIGGGIQISRDIVASSASFSCPSETLLAD